MALDFSSQASEPAPAAPLDFSAQVKPPPEPDMTPFRDQIRKNLVAAGASEEGADAAGEMGEFGLEQAFAVGSAAAAPAVSPEERAAIDRGPVAMKVKGERPARSFDDALSAGLQMSVTGLLMSGKAPTKVLAEDAPMASRIAANVATVAGDLPWMLAGAVLGGGAGAPSGPGAVMTAGAGAFGLPAGLRATLMDAYQNGDFKSFGDFWERASGIVWQEIKGEITGAATAGAGAAAKVALPAAAPMAVRLAAPTAAEIATMTSVGAALDGRVPKAQEFMDAAIVLGGFKAASGANTLAGKLRDVYAKTGTSPQELIAQAAKDPTIVQDLVAENREIPQSLRPQALGAQPGEARAAAAGEEAAAPEPPASKAVALDAVAQAGDAVRSGGVSKDALDALDSARKTAEEQGATQAEIIDAIRKVPEESGTEAPRAFVPRAQRGSVVLGGEGIVPPRASEAQVPEEPTPEEAVLDRVSVGDHAGKGYGFDKFYTDMKDELYPLRVVTEAMRAGSDLAVSQDPYKLARLTRGSAGKADQFIELSPFKFDTYENVGKPLKAILAPVKDGLDGLRAYAVARRSIELAKRGIETGVPQEEAAAVVKGGGKYEQPFKDLVEYQDHLVRYLADAGVLSKDGIAAMREANRDYVPFFRLMDEEKRGGAGPGLSVRSPIKGIKGSERQIIDPLESIVKNTYLFTALADRAAVGRALLELAQKSGNEDLMKKVSAPSKGVTVTDKEVQAFMDAHGIEGEGEAFDIFRRGYMNPAEDQIVVYRDGQREIYEVPRSVAAAFKGLDHESAGLLAKVLAIPAKTLRAGATLTPDFFLRNFNRDQLSAAVFSNSGYLPVIDFVRGFAGVAMKDADFQAWLKSGGANATMLSMDRRYLQEKLAQIAELDSVRDKAWNVVKMPLDMLRITSELVENATRLGEFKRATGGDLSKESAQAAGFESREVTLDFARIGAKTRGMNMITAFWNAQVEGLDRAARAFKDDPFGTALKIGGYITVPSLLLWWANHDDPRWKQIPDWERDLFWLVMTKDHIYRIPKPFELGALFGSAPERMMDSLMDAKPDAFNNLGKSLANVFGFNTIPTAALPILEHMTNHSFFTDRPLVPSNLEKLLPEYQYSNYTSETTKALGHMIGSVPGMHDASAASPMVIDNYIRGWSGGMGVYAMQIADLALRKSGVLPDPVKPTPTLADIPVIKAFVVRYPSSQAQSIQDFNEHYKESKMVVETVQYLARQGEADAALREARMDPTKLIKLDNIHAGLGNAQRVIQMIDKNPAMQPDEKRQLIDTTYMQMIEMATEGEKTLREIKRELAPEKDARAKKPAAAPEVALANP